MGASPPRSSAGISPPEKRDAQPLRRLGRRRAAAPQRNEHFDPVLDRAITALTPAMAHYMRQELGFKTDLEYRLLNREVSGAGLRHDARAGRASPTRWAI